jgi:hypothetical protein
MWLGCRVRYSGDNEPVRGCRDAPWGGAASPSGSRRTVRCPVQSEDDVWLNQACRLYPGARGSDFAGPNEKRTLKQRLCRTGSAPSRALDGPRGSGPSPCFVARNQFIYL